MAASPASPNLPRLKKVPQGLNTCDVTKIVGLAPLKVPSERRRIKMRGDDATSWEAWSSNTSLLIRIGFPVEKGFQFRNGNHILRPTSSSFRQDQFVQCNYLERVAQKFK